MCRAGEWLMGLWPSGNRHQRTLERYREQVVKLERDAAIARQYRAEAEAESDRQDELMPVIEAMTGYLEQRGTLNGFTRSLRDGARRRLAGE